MRSSYLPLLLGFAIALALPSAAFAQDYSPFEESAQFDALPIEGTTTSVTVLNPTGQLYSTSVKLPFVYFFFGQPYDQVNISGRGYITFGTATTGQANAAHNNNQEIPTSAAPTGLVAAWWDNLICPATSVKTQTFKDAAGEWFVIEWNGCHPDGATAALIRTQIWMERGSHVIRAYYGAEVPASTNHSATMGLENPATYDSAGGIVAYGGSIGTYGRLDDAGVPLCKANCDSTHWPANKMIQYGRPKIPDLRAGALRFASLEMDDQNIEVVIENSIENFGKDDVQGVTWDLYLSEDDRLDEDDRLLPECRHASLKTVPGVGSMMDSYRCTFALPTPGSYHFCVMIDPDDVIVEANETNNAYCSGYFVFGADLTGSISIPRTGGVGSRVPVNVFVENIGFDPAEQVEFTVTWKDCAGKSPDRLAYAGIVSVGSGNYYNQVLDLYVDSSIEDAALCAELVIDRAGVIPEQDESNNVVSTCVGSDRTCMTLTRPDLRVNRIHPDMPNGCFFGGPVDLEIEICNDGATAASNFSTVVNVGGNSIVEANATPVLAIPRSCAVTDPVTGLSHNDSSLCLDLDLGGGTPSCIKGLCHTPCNSNADCGDQGLVCSEDPLLEDNGVRYDSCQLVLPAGSCESIRASASLPSMDTSAANEQHPDGLPFTDGNYTIGAVIDWTSRVAESNEVNNRKGSDDRFTCWTPKPDFQAVELRSLSPVGAGERFPVYRKVRNNGTVDSGFAYQYVLSSNERPSKYDIHLEIVRFEGGRIVGEDRIGDDAIDGLTELEAFDTVRVPAGVVPGIYYLGIVIDSADKVFEITNENNAIVWCDTQPDGSCVPHPIQVVDPSLRIVTQGLPTATVGVSYDVQLLATGGVGGHVWRVSSGGLPPGLSLDPSGRIHGNVHEQGDAVFQVTVSSGDVSDSATFAIRAMAARGPLVITTAGLPTAYVNIGYAAGLGASGGTPPYGWTCGGLPHWARLDGNTIQGTPTAAANAVSVGCTVTDAAEQTLSADYTLRVKAVSDLRISSTSIGAFDVGVQNSATIGAVGGSGSYRWAFDKETLPAGLEAVESGNRGVIEGTPLVCGHFLVGVTVTDTVSEDTDSASLPLLVACDAPRLAARDLPVAVRGQDYPETQLIAERAVSFAVAHGELPRGLVLSNTGLLSGTVAIDANVGDHGVAIELRDATGGTGLGALTIVVQSSGSDIVQVEKVEKGGCSAADGSSAPGLIPLALLSAFLGLRRSRSRKIGVFLVAALAMLAPATARAQDYPGYGMNFADVEYERLVGAIPVLDTCGDYPVNNCVSQSIHLPFTFGFFDQEYSRVWIDSSGLLYFSSSSVNSTNDGVPSPAAPNNFIAPWWDHLEIDSAGDVRYLVRGTAPNREFVVEWLVRPWPGTGRDLAEMQVSLYEDGNFAMRWGSAGPTETYTATVGIEDAFGSARSMSVLPCARAGNCSRADWTAQLRSKEAFFSSGPNLVILETSTMPEGRGDFEQEFRVTARNTGLTSARAAIELFLSEDREISPDDHSIGRTPILDFGAGETVQDSITLPLPRVLDPGPYYVLARVDPDFVVEEFSETDNDGGAFRFVILDPAPDLAIDRVDGPSSGSAGSRVAVELQVANLGNVEARDVSYAIVLSTNEAISEDDPVIDRGSFGIGSMNHTTITALVKLPADTRAGRYYLGARIDPENAIPEVDELNNVRASEGTIQVTTDDLRAVTQLPAALQVGAPYCFPLEAEGGDGVYTWSLVEGTLPPGLVLSRGGEADPDGGSLCGAPSTVGIFKFTLEVASHGMTARMESSLEVAVVSVQLGVATHVLPIATFGALYEAGLSANGGRPPYRWSMSSGELPAGLNLGEDGLVYGVPLVDGEFRLEVRVHDANDKTATASVELGISSPGRVICSTRTLGSIDLGSEVDGQLLAGGGSGSYVWRSMRTQRFGDWGGLPLANEEGPPPGFELRTTGALDGMAIQVGQYLWMVEVSDEGQSANADICTISVEVLPGPGLTVTTMVMPLALVDEEYAVQLEAAGGDGNYRWTLVDARSLPDGLGLGESGVVSGKLAVADLQEKESRTWSFLVQVRDGQNNRGIGAMTVTLTTRRDLATVPRRTETTDSGCSTGGGSFGLVSFGLVLLGLRRRR